MSAGRKLEKATLTHLGSLESLPVLWNPERYSLSRRSRLASPDVVGSARSPLQSVAGGVEEFTADLLLDSSRKAPGERDLRPLVKKLESWMDPPPSADLPDRVLFSWGSFRFRGVVSSLEQAWVLFDPDGTAVRGWIRLTLRG